MPTRNISAATLIALSLSSGLATSVQGQSAQQPDSPAAAAPAATPVPPPPSTTAPTPAAAPPAATTTQAPAASTPQPPASATAPKSNALPEVKIIQDKPKPKPVQEAAPKPKPKPAPVAEDVAPEPAPVAKPKKKKPVVSEVVEPKPKPKAKPKPAPVEAFPEPQPPSQADTSTAIDSATAAPLPGTLIVSDDAFTPVTTATAREIDAKQGQTIADTLATKPGVNASTFAPGASRPIVRGLDNNRVRVQENGIGTHDVSTLSEDHAIPVDPYAAERVEVIRGPETLRYGGQASGGVVSVENERIPTYMPRYGFSGEIKGGLSSVDDGRDGAFKATAGVNGIVVHADGFKRQAEDYRTPRGIEANSYADSEGGSVGASLVGSDGFLGIAVARVTSNYGIPGEAAHIELEQDKILSKGEWRARTGGIDTVRFWFGASDYAHDEVSPEGEVGSRFTNREQEFRGEVQQQTIATSLGELNSSLGLQWGHRNLRGQSFEGTSLLEPAETDRLAGFLFQDLSLTRQLKLMAAGRIEHVKHDGTGLLDFSDPLNLVAFTGEKSFTPGSVSAGLAYEIPLGIVARLTGLYFERAPEAEELFSQGLHEATGTFEIGDPNLEKEKAKTIEVGVKKVHGGFRFDGSLFYTRYDGFISKGLTGVRCGPTIDTCGVEDELDQLLFTQRDARFYGAELAVQYDVAPIWNGVWGVDGQYDFVNAKFSDGENVPRIPPHRLGAGIFYRDAQWFARAGVLHAFEQDRIATTETPTDGYTLVSAELSYTTKLTASGAVQPVFTIGIKGENLADDEVRNHSSFKKDEVLQPGANVRLFGTLKLN
jgi:iron complex outermembrane recepter protein